jgi:hypothetical protein
MDGNGQMEKETFNCKWVDVVEIAWKKKLWNDY